MIYEVKPRGAGGAHVWVDVPTTMTDGAFSVLAGVQGGLVKAAGNAARAAMGTHTPMSLAEYADVLSVTGARQDMPLVSLARNLDVMGPGTLSCLVAAIDGIENGWEQVGANVVSDKTQARLYGKLGRVLLLQSSRKGWAKLDRVAARAAPVGWSDMGTD